MVEGEYEPLPLGDFGLLQARDSDSTTAPLLMTYASHVEILTEARQDGKAIRVDLPGVSRYAFQLGELLNPELAASSGIALYRLEGTPQALAALNARAPAYREPLAVGDPVYFYLSETRGNGSLWDTATITGTVETPIQAFPILSPDLQGPLYLLSTTQDADNYFANGSPVYNASGEVIGLCVVGSNPTNPQQVGFIRLTEGLLGASGLRWP